MFDISRVGRDFSAAAADYDGDSPLQARVLFSLIQRAAPLLVTDALILDAGCGTGRLAKKMDGGQVFQLDLAPEMCRFASRQGPPAVNASVEMLPFADESFDAVFSSLVLQWVPDWEKAVEEMRRVLKPKGVLALSSFGPLTLKELKESFKAVDAHAHVSTFLPRFNGMQHETITEYYPDIFALMRHLKTIGARNKLLDRRKSLMTRGQMARVQQAYHTRFANEAGLPATWEILYSVTCKS